MSTGIQAVIDHRFGGEGTAFASNSYQKLSEPEWFALRRVINVRINTEKPALACANCGGRVYARLSEHKIRHFCHHPIDETDCSWRKEQSRSRKSIDAEKFQGRQEGEKHKYMCELVENIVKIDLDSSDIMFFRNRFFRGRAKDFTFPDVYVEKWNGYTTVFEVQLASTHIPDIVRRENFYNSNTIRLVWVLDNNLNLLNRASFKDIYLNNDGQAISVDKDCLSVSEQANRSHFRLIRVLPKIVDGGIRLRVRSKIKRSDEIHWGEPGGAIVSKNASYDDYLDKTIKTDTRLTDLREDFYRSLSNRDLELAQKSWNEIAARVGGLAWGQMEGGYQDLEAMAVLATFRTGRNIANTKYSLDRKKAIINSMILDRPRRRRWAKVLLQQIKSFGWLEILRNEVFQRKYSECLADKDFELQETSYAGFVLDVLFPEGAFQRLTTESFENLE